MVKKQALNEHGVHFMSLGVRGSNPIWMEVDLQGNLFDDTFYLFVLENEIPYIPAKVYHDPNLNIVWNNPIRFFANGTLPNNIYFESNKVYRLEFRQGDTQNDPLIYEVNNYVAGQGGDSPITTGAFATSNQITNPQFALTSFTSPLVLTGITDPDPIPIGPGWSLELAGTGNVTITKVALNDDNANPSNAPYALQLTLSGWDDEGVFLTQRFEQNGMLWANKVVSTSITARIEGAPQSISARLVDSNGTPTQVLERTTINEDWNEFTDYGEVGEPTNPDLPPAAYLDYRLALPRNVDIYVTSIQLIVQDLPLEPKFEQDSINRQIDHTYNTAYPIVPVGTIIDYYGFGTVPPHYLECNGQSLSRTVFNQLFDIVTTVETVTLTTGTNTFTVADGSIYAINYPVEGTGITLGTFISDIVGNTITISSNATATGPSDVRFFAVNNGDGSTTYNAPELRGYVIAGSGAPAFGDLLSSTGIGSFGGSTEVTLDVTQLPSHTHPPLSPQFGFIGAGGGPPSFAASAGPDESSAATTGATGDGMPHPNVQPTLLARKIIRFE